MRRPGLLVIVCGMLAFPAVPAGPPDASWRRVREGENVVVYTRDVAGSSFDESLAQTVVTHRLSALVALIMDGDTMSRWVDTIKESRGLHAPGPTEAYIYMVSGAPWPVSDRDAVVLSRVEQDDETLVVTIRTSARPDYLPRREGMVRVPHVESSWTLRPRAEGTVEVSYRAHSDPGGTIPGWLINSLSTDQPFNTLRNLHRFLDGDEEYRGAVLPYIREPRH